jgi:signal transduction histidine kinase
MMWTISNLCETVVKFAGHVTVRHTTADYAIAVSDDGPGVLSELQTRVLELFFKVDHARVDGKAGFGLALSIVTDTVQTHHGLLELSGARPTA